ncbi:hypothetical protein DM02DRAFT_733131 [Periconia macrospinosa]|uniref:F-box domain-containing protein n=1 Tax=Periconia macrospinosa TaxID=97972 RepID=A0A2V1D8C2_9PLEO|nr:hypothetical protein DM02DRAFT_733131 [Periconia macrospinosa]
MRDILLPHWKSIPGDEFLVFDPGLNTVSLKNVVKVLEKRNTPLNRAQKVLQEARLDSPLKLAAKVLHKPKTDTNVASKSSQNADELVDVTAKVLGDPFVQMPYDITLEIMSYLPAQSWLNWLTASRPIYGQTCQVAFWQRMCRIDILPWFPELEPLLEKYEESASKNSDQACMDIKSLYIYVQHATDPKAGRPGPLMGIANRRRIITACQVFVEPYVQYLNNAENAQT